MQVSPPPVPHFAEPPVNTDDPTCSQIHLLESAIPQLLHRYSLYVQGDALQLLKVTVTVRSLLDQW